MNQLVPRAAAVAVALLATTWAPTVRAQPADDPPPAVPPPLAALPPPAAPPARDVMITRQVTTPNADLLGAGALTLGLSYGTAFFVATQSPLKVDTTLFIPLAGPWIDLAQRDKGCPASCPNDTANKVLLVTDGVFQLFGVGQIAGGFLFPQTRLVTRIGTVEVAPTAGLHNVGLTASGSF